MFERSVLSSGIRVVTESMPGARSVAVGAWVGVGSRDESTDVCGATHFLEHLLFKGTASRTALGIAEAFDAVGGDLNAFTTKEATCFHARVLPVDLSMAVDVVADMLQNSLLAPADVEAERSVVIEEIAMHEDTPDDIVFDVFHEALWADDSLGRRVQGTTGSIQAMSLDALAGFYHTRYVPQNIVVSAAGALSHEQVVELVDRAFTPRRVEAASRAHDVPQPASGALVQRKRDIEQTHMVYGAPGIPRADDRRWALGVLNAAFGGGMSSRLFQEIRERRGLAYTIASGHEGFSDTGVFSIYAGCSSENVREVLTIARAELDAVIAEGITDAELERSIGQLRGSMMLGLDEPSALMSHLGKSELAPGEVLTPEEMIRRIEAVTQDDVREVARDVLGAPGWSLVVLGPSVDADVSGFVGAAA